nr:MAG TPA: hypothetical protein [Caudoviricetes sp.]
MATGFVDSAKATILNGMTGRTQYATLASTCLIGIGTVDDLAFTEPNKTTGYERTLLGNYQSKDSQLMGEPVGGNIKNSKIIYLPEAISSWGTVTHFALFSSSTAESPFFIGALKNPMEIPAGYVPIFRTNTLSITII